MGLAGLASKLMGGGGVDTWGIQLSSNAEPPVIKPFLISNRIFDSVIVILVYPPHSKWYKLIRGKFRLERILDV